jgi:hypothetical protein
MMKPPIMTSSPPSTSPRVEMLMSRGGLNIEKLAVIAVAALTVTWQVPVPAHGPPLQPSNTEPGAGLAVSVTVVPELKLATQVAPQLMPAGEEVTVPVPLPARLTVRLNAPTAKVAVTLAAALIVTTQVPVPAHPPPDQPLKVEPGPGVAVSVTTVPESKLATQVAPQLIPAGDEATVPVPPPALFTVSA